MEIKTMQSGAIRPINNMLPRKLFNAEHEAFRDTVRKFYEKEVVPNIAKYEEQQHVDRDLWNKAGEKVLPGLDRRRKEEMELFMRK